MKKGRYCQVAVALPIFETFTYLVPDEIFEELKTGHRVLLPFGPRRITGYVISRADTCAFDSVKPILEIMDPEPAFDEVRFKLFKFISDYYLAPLGEVIKTALPAGINRASKTTWKITDQGLRALDEPGLPVAERGVLLCMDKGVSYSAKQLAQKTTGAYQVILTRLEKKGCVEKIDALEKATTSARYVKVYTPVSDENVDAVLSRAPKQADVYRFLQRACEADSSTVNAALPGAGSALDALTKRGLVTVRQEECYRGAPCDYQETASEKLVLNTHQQRALDDVSKSMDKGGYAPFLIHGVTGSGKTEVYIRLAQHALEMGKSALVLVPEISLTPQLVSRFARRFGSRIAVSHSGLSNVERYDQFRRMLRGEADLCIGTRSALFAPLPDLGLVIVDEEHDSSYKQDEGVPYNARDLALFLGKSVGACVVLGSATPSVESYRAAWGKKYRLLEIPERATAGTLPEIEVVDLAVEMALAHDKKMSQRKTKPGAKESLPVAAYGFSDIMWRALEKTLGEKHQAILFLNRRGFSSRAFCLECKRTVMCPNCAVSLTAHAKGRTLHCHYCGHSQPADIVCPDCGGINFYLAGMGTEQVESEVQKRFPDAKIARLDRDTTTVKGAMMRILSDFAARKYDVLVGTQMVTKGHDFPHVTLVGVLTADQGMALPDFRSGERTFQLLSQVAGRAGRGDYPGRVIVQTFSPDHYSISAACHHDYKGFFNREMESRTFPPYPPFARIALFRAKSLKENKARSFLLMVANSLRQTVRENQMEKVLILGPTASPISKITNQYRFQMLIKAPTPSVLLQVARQALEEAGKWNHPGVTWHLDVDPQNML